MSTAQVLVTGGTGFIGRHLVSELLAQKHSIRILTRRPQVARSLHGDTVDIFHGNIESPKSCDKACAGIELLVHCAGCYAFGLNRSKNLQRVNVDGTTNLFQAAWQHKINRVVHVGSAGVLHGNHLPLTESDYSARPHWSCPYKISKWKSEQVAEYWRKKGLPIVTVNPTCPMGAGDETPTPTGRIVQDYLKRLFLFSTRTGINIVDVEDLARGIVSAVRYGRDGERYILGHHNIMLKDLLQMLGKLTGIPAPQIELPWPLILVGGVLGEFCNLLDGGRNISPLNLETAIQSRRLQFFDCSKAARDLNWKPAGSLESTLTRSVAYFKAAMVAG